MHDEESISGFRSCGRGGIGDGGGAPASRLPLACSLRLPYGYTRSHHAYVAVTSWLTYAYAAITLRLRCAYTTVAEWARLQTSAPRGESRGTPLSDNSSCTSGSMHAA